MILDYLAVAVGHQLVADLDTLLWLQVTPWSVNSSRLQNCSLRDMSAVVGGQIHLLTMMVLSYYLLTGEIRWVDTLPAPADSPKSVICSPSP